ncbi:recombination regulator RecX [Litchfieldia salsa]|uniref:Regulatory protein RecX n=1 Tax=Litchfieldia salsa TaxID=930152 RepID=A0A1H0WN99_9BACI|nr:recombination regulator RecX [Litchfieldia salsa]SDP91746.1 regulatory protein [Litchfieldia salsa]
MAVIKRITTQKKNKERFNIFLDHGNGKEEYAFSVDQNVLIKFQLQKGLELDDLDLSEIQFDDEVKKGINTAVHYLSHRMRSEKEVVDYLKKKEVDGPIIQEILHKLGEYNYINDRDFAIAYVRTQMNTTQKGPEVIKRELNEKGIVNHLIGESLEEFKEEQQLATAKNLVEKLHNKSSKVSSMEQRQKIETALRRKGFPWNIIEAALAESEDSLSEEDEWDALKHQGEKAIKKYQKFEGYIFEQKVKQALYRKGFNLGQIERYLDSIKEE